MTAVTVLFKLPQAMSVCQVKLHHCTGLTWAPFACPVVQEPHSVGHFYLHIYLKNNLSCLSWESWICILSMWFVHEIKSIYNSSVEEKKRQNIFTEANYSLWCSCPLASESCYSTCVWERVGMVIRSSRSSIKHKQFLNSTRTSARLDKSDSIFNQSKLSTVGLLSAGWHC